MLRFRTILINAATISSLIIFLCVNTLSAMSSSSRIFFSRGTVVRRPPIYNGGGSWTTWDKNATRALRFLASMGCNLTRGLESGLSYNDPYAYLAEYKRRLDIAETYGLKVHAGIGSYKQLNEKKVDLEYFKTQFLPVVLQDLKDETRITCLDIDDEPDLADPNNVQFIEDVYAIVKRYDPNHPVSIGGWRYDDDWHNPIHLPIILDYVDWIGLHMYPPDGRGDGHIPTGLSAEEVRLETYNAFKAQIQASSAWGKPVIVTEYGINFTLVKEAYSRKARKMAFFWAWGALDAFQDSNITYKIFYQLGNIPNEDFSIVTSREGRHPVQREIAARYLPKRIIRAPTSPPPLENNLPEISVENLPLLKGFGEDFKLYGVYDDPLEAWDNYLTYLKEEFGPNVNHVRLAITTVANTMAPKTFLDFQYINQLLQIFERHQIYAILDAHHEPFIPLHYPDLFIEQWVEIAKYYNESTVVLAYELWNEPGLTWFPTDTVPILRRCYDAIRQVAPKKPVIFEGSPFTDANLSSQLLYGLPETFWSFHRWRIKLQNRTEADKAIADIIAELEYMRNQYDIEPWIGEIGCIDVYKYRCACFPKRVTPEVQNYYLTKLVETAVAHDIGYALWETILHRDRYDALLPKLFS